MDQTLAFSRIDDMDSGRLPAGNLQVSLTDPFMKGTVLPFQTVPPWPALSPPSPPPNPTEADGNGAVEENGEIGREPLAHQTVQLFHEVGGQPTPRSLVGDGGVREPVAEDNAPLFQGRPDHLAEMLSSRRLVEEEFDRGVH